MPMPMPMPMVLRLRDHELALGLTVLAFVPPLAAIGGQFGPEASIVAILVCGVPTVLFLRLARKRGRILRRRA